MRIAIAADHAGFRYKALLVRHLAAWGHDVLDFGTPLQRRHCVIPVNRWPVKTLATTRR